MAETGGAGAEMLQDIVRRLSEELARHQQVMSSDVTTDYQTSAAAVKASSTAPEKSSVWPSSALSPLLVSYDRELAKKDAALDSQRLELLKVKEEMSLIVTENGLLHEELNRTKACLNDALGARETALTTDVGRQVADASSLGRDARKLLTQENDLLVTQQREYQDEMSHLEERIDALTATVSSLKAEKEAAQDSCDAQKQAITAMESRVAQVNAENANLNALLLEKTRVTEEAKVVMGAKANDDEAKLKFDETVSSYQNEVDRLSQENAELLAQLSVGEKAHSTLLAQLSSATASLRQIEESTSTKVHEADFFRTKAMQFEQNMHDMRAHEADLILKADDALGAASTARILSEQASKSLGEKNSEIDILKSQLSAQKKKLFDVTHAKHTQLQKEYKLVCQEKHDAARAFETTIADLKFKCGRLEHELADRNATIEKLREEAVVASIDAETRNDTKCVDSVNVYEEQVRKLAELRRDRDQATEKATLIELDAERSEHRWGREKATLIAQQSEALTKAAAVEEEREKLADEISKLQRERNELVRGSRVRESEHRHVMNALKASSEATLIEQHQRIHKLQAALDKNIATKLGDISHAQTMLQKSEDLTHRFKEEAERTRAHLESTRRDADTKLGDLREQLTGALERVKVLTAEKDELECALSSTKESLASAKPTLDTHRKREAGMKEYIREILRERDTLQREKANYLSALDEMDMLKQRATRQRDSALDKVKILQKVYATSPHHTAPPVEGRKSLLS